MSCVMLLQRGVCSLHKNYNNSNNNISHNADLARILIHVVCDVAAAG